MQLIIVTFVLLKIARQLHLMRVEQRSVITGAQNGAGVGVARLSVSHATRSGCRDSVPFCLATARETIKFMFKVKHASLKTCWEIFQTLRRSVPRGMLRGTARSDLLKRAATKRLQRYLCRPTIFLHVT